MFQAERGLEMGITTRDKLLKDNPEVSQSFDSWRSQGDILHPRNSPSLLLIASFLQALILRGYSLKCRLSPYFKLFSVFYNTMKNRIQLKVSSCELPCLFRGKMGFKY